MSRQPFTRLLCTCAAALALAGCGGGEVSGRLTGLGTGLSVTLQNNAADALTLRSNGEFAFATLLDPGDTYAVTVQVQPTGQSCTVSNGSGTLNAEGDSVDTVRVSCSFLSTLRGSVNGLAAGASLTLANGSETVAVSASGAFAFSTTLSEGTAYNVSVLTQPAIGSCSVANASGRFFAASFVDIVVSCN